MGSAVDLVATGRFSSLAAVSGLAGVESPAGLTLLTRGLTSLGLTRVGPAPDKISLGLITPADTDSGPRGY